MNGMYQKPGSPEEADQIRQYFLQLRHETGNNLLTAGVVVVVGNK